MTQVLVISLQDLGIKTIVLMADTPLLYGSYSPRMYPNYSRWRKYSNTQYSWKRKINPDKIFDQLNKILIKKYLLKTISLASFTIVDNLAVSGEISG